MGVKSRVKEKIDASSKDAVVDRYQRVTLYMVIDCEVGNINEVVAKVNEYATLEEGVVEFPSNVVDVHAFGERW